MNVDTRGPRAIKPPIFAKIPVRDLQQRLGSLDDHLLHRWERLALKDLRA